MRAAATATTATATATTTATPAPAPAVSCVSLLHLLAERPGPAVVRFAFEYLSRDFIADDSLA